MESSQRPAAGVGPAALRFLGGAGTVTGSRFLVETPQSRVLVDAGLYQGLKELRQRNWQEFPVDPATLDAVILTHAHLDHCGYLPRLVREGFAGPIVCTAETKQLAAIVLRDSARLQEEDARHANLAGYSKHKPALPLYDDEDVTRTLPLFSAIDLHIPAPVADDITATFYSAGHILGAVSVLVDTGADRIMFSGDLGRRTHPLVPHREDPPAAEIAVVESTYGNRSHDPGDVDVLADTVRRTINRGGSVLIPAFAIDRTELVLLRLGELMRAGEIPAVPVHLDSPMALAALDVYANALHEADLGVPDLRLATTVDESIRLNAPSFPCIVISASGMATGGRVVHHLRHQLPDPRNSVILTGYQAAGTRGRALIEGATEVKIHGEWVPVRAECVLDGSFSVHSDADETIDWLRQMPEPPRAVYLVHGEPEAATALAERIGAELGWEAVVAAYGDRVPLNRAE